MSDQTFPHTVLAETMLHYVFVAKTNVWAISAMKNMMDYPTAAALFVSLIDLVARQLLL